MWPIFKKCKKIEKLEMEVNFFLGMFCPLGRFVHWDILSLGTFCPLGHFVLGTFCPWDVLSLGTFCPWDLMSEDVLSWNVLSLGTFCLGMFCLCTEISSTEILTEGRPGVPAQSLKFGNTGFARSLADETAESVIHKYSV